MSLSMTSWILGLGGYAGLLTGLGLFALYGDMSLLYAALLPLCPLIGAGAFYTFFHTVLLVIENAVRVGYLMLNEQIVVVTISSVFLGLQACMLGIILYTQLREAHVQPERPIPEQEEVVEEEVEATEEEAEITSAEQNSVEDDMPDLIPADSIDRPMVPVTEPVVPTVEPTVVNERFPPQTSIPSTIVPSIASIYMDMVPLGAPKNTQSNDVEFTYLDKDLA